MKIPSKIKIGGIWYKVEMTDDDNMAEAIADTNFNKSVIRISNLVNREQQELAFIHEIIHCINNQLKEEEVEFLAMAIYQIIKDNNIKL